jgi:hypothetical protein
MADPVGGSPASAPIDTPRLRLASSNALDASRFRTPASNRRLLLVISHGLPPDALDSEWKPAEQAYPDLRHWVVQMKHAIRERGVQTPSAPQ